MKINKSVEPAIYVLCILALQKEHKPVKSHLLSQILQVSDSYLKKILNKMVKADLITSNASKNGGFQLKKTIEKITLLDVFQALELDKNVLSFQKLGSYVFVDDLDHEKEGEEKIIQTFQKALQAFYDELDQLPIADLIRTEYLLDGRIDWEKIQLESS